MPCSPCFIPLLHSTCSYYDAAFKFCTMAPWRSTFITTASLTALLLWFIWQGIFFHFYLFANGQFYIICINSIITLNIECASTPPIGLGIQKSQLLKYWETPLLSYSCRSFITCQFKVISKIRNTYLIQ